MGGLVGGLLAAYLLGPNLRAVRPPGSKRTEYVDAPPIGLFASQLGRPSNT